MKRIMKSFKNIIRPIIGIVIVVLISNFTMRAPLQEGVWKAPAYADTIKNPLKKDATAAVAGKKIYETVCFVCHGLTGKGDGAASANLKPKPADFSSDAVQKQSDGALFWKLTEGKGQMTSYEEINTEKERWQLVSYIRTLKQPTKK